MHGDTNLENYLNIDHFIFPMLFKYTLRNAEISYAEVMIKRDKMLIKAVKFWMKLLIKSVSTGIKLFCLSSQNKFCNFFTTLMCL